MASYNRVFLMGNLTRDPLTKHLPSNTTVAEFGLAVSRRYRTSAGEDKEEVAFVDCTAFGRQAETISQYCTKGKPIFIEGRLKFDTWDDKAGGGKRSKLTVVVENFQFLGRPGDGFGDDEPPQREERQSRPVNHRGPLENRGGQHQGAAANFVRAMGGGKPQREPATAPFSPDDQHFNDDQIPFRWEGPRRSML